MKNETLSLPDGPLARIPIWKPVLFAAFAGGMGWGIRGQYGHETGAMIAGLLVSLVLALVFCPHGQAGRVARAVAWGTIAIGFGGSMTYGQTVGLTHDAALIGQGAALRWGMLGLAVKGALWIGFAGAFLGMGLSGVQYRVREMFFLMLGLLALHSLGCWVFNQPFDPAAKLLPKIYFSDDWRWKLGLEWKPRREVWGGFLVALAGLVAWTHWFRRDGLAPRLAFWGVLGGAIGFPLGQCLQAYHAWNPELFRQGIWAVLDPKMNWWNWMETTFGAVMGGTLGLGLWLNRHRIRVHGEPPFAPRMPRDHDPIQRWGETPSSPGILVGDQVRVRQSLTPPQVHDEEPIISLGPLVEWPLLILHLSLLVTGEFLSVGWVGALYDPGLVLGFIPIVAVTGGRAWPYLLMLPVTMVPIAGKTLRQLVYSEHLVGTEFGWLMFVVLPVTVTLGMAWWFARPSEQGREARTFLRPVLLVATWLYFGLNWTFFHLPWPWVPWTSRTPNGLAFAVCALGLTGLALFGGREAAASSGKPAPPPTP